MLAVLTTSQATEIFDAVEVSELSDAQAQEIVNTVQNAPEEVKNAFEAEISNWRFRLFLFSDSKANHRRKVIKFLAFEFPLILINTDIGVVIR